MSDGLVVDCAGRLQIDCDDAVCLFFESHTDREIVVVSAVDVFFIVDDVFLDRRETRRAGHDVVDHQSFGDVILVHDAFAAGRVFRRHKSEPCAGTAYLMFIYIFVKEPGRSGITCTAVEHDLFRVCQSFFDRTVTGLDIEYHIGLELFPQLFGQFQILLHYHGAVYRANRSPESHVDPDPEFFKSFPYADFVGTAASAAAEYKSGLFHE